MPMNTPYLGSSATVPGNLNTSYLSTGITEVTSALSVWGPVTAARDLAVGSMATSASTSYNANTFQLAAQGARFLSRNTTASATSLIIQDGEFALAFVSVTSARLVFRSGNTTYTWIATTGAVL